ncbi:LLM class flavin-dependent oxidoreductase [Rathayibacter toxicus]|uniref:LLM class flavin-dependent oxidoreductase n=1 Tax=Rathayibacter toxicus TaxID=145458 RepID=UPI001C043A1D|nr:LLM class flavin-dependent oxidoreductase [Rathayibacter toxicus]QWL30903.1 LLM class flavin-dependent oxidoreductase [Rathayibacter toxicus]
MKFGLSFLPDVTEDQLTAARYFADVAGLCKWGESVGFDYVKMTEHYMHAYGGFCPSPLTFLSWIGAQTKSIRLLTGCVIPSFHHPVELASHTTMVDALTEGRLEVGFARGYLPHEFDTFGINMDTSSRRFEESVQAVIRLWTERGVTLRTPFFSFDDVTILPRPTQASLPPFWIAAVKSRRSFERAGILGANLLINPSVTRGDIDNISTYRDAFRSHHPNKLPRVAASVPVFVNADSNEARLVADEYLRKYLKVWASATSAWGNRTSSSYAAYTGMSRFIGSLTAKDLRLSGSAIVGDPVEVSAKIRSFQQLLGVDVMLCQVDYGGMPADLARASMELFAREVMPEFRSNEE